LLLLDGVTGTKRRDATRRPEGHHCREGCIRKTRLNSKAQNNLIVSGKSQKQKWRAKFAARPHMIFFCGAEVRETLRPAASRENF
jgi:hypothetical protein